jgi:hypothetical protein
MEEPTYLSTKHAHERDSHIVFDEGPHIYTIDGDSDYMSVTTWNHSHFPHFDADAIITKMMNSPKWEKNKYFGMTRDEIKQLWDLNGQEASRAGTKMHFDIECYYNDMDVEVEENCLEWKYFEEFEKKIGYKLEPYRTEWMIWDSELKFAGSIDMVFKDEDGNLQIYDWKRCKEIKKTNQWDSAVTKCISHLPDSNFWHYALQLNTYKYLLEKNYGVHISKMCLVCLHPNNKNKSFIQYEVPYMPNEIKDLMQERKLRLQQINS